MGDVYSWSNAKTLWEWTMAASGNDFKGLVVTRYLALATQICHAMLTAETEGEFKFGLREKGVLYFIAGQDEYRLNLISYGQTYAANIVLNILGKYHKLYERNTIEYDYALEIKKLLFR